MPNATWRLREGYSGRRKDILKEERTSERKTRQESEEKDYKRQCYGLSCFMDHRYGLREKET